MIQSNTQLLWWANSPARDEISGKFATPATSSRVCYILHASTNCLAGSRGWQDLASSASCTSVQFVGNNRIPRPLLSMFKAVVAFWRSILHSLHRIKSRSSLKPKNSCLPTLTWFRGKLASRAWSNPGGRSKRATPGDRCSVTSWASVCYPNGVGVLEKHLLPFLAVDDFHAPR